MVIDDLLRYIALAITYLMPFFLYIAKSLLTSNRLIFYTFH